MIVGSGTLCERLTRAMAASAVRAESARLTPPIALLRGAPPSVIVLTGSAASHSSDFCREASNDPALAETAILVLTGGTVALALMDLPRVAVLPPGMDAKRIAPIVVGLAGWGGEEQPVPVWKRVEALLHSVDQRLDSFRASDPETADTGALLQAAREESAPAADGRDRRVDQPGNEDGTESHSTVDEHEVEVLDELRAPRLESDPGASSPARRSSIPPPLPRTTPSSTPPATQEGVPPAPQADAPPTRAVDLWARASGFAALAAVLLLLYRDHAEDRSSSNPRGTQQPPTAQLQSSARHDTPVGTPKGVITIWAGDPSEDAGRTDAAGDRTSTGSKRSDASEARELTPVVGTRATDRTSTEVHSDPGDKTGVRTTEAHVPKAAPHGGERSQLATAEPVRVPAAPPANDRESSANRRSPTEQPASGSEAKTGRLEQLAEATQLVDRGLFFMRNGKHGKAAALFERAAERAPFYPRALASAARAHLQSGDVGAAVLWAERLTNAQPRVASYQLLLGDALMRAGRRSEATSAWQRAAGAGSSEAEARLSPR